MAADSKNLLRIASAILPKKYEISIVFASNKLALSLNKKYRGRNYTPNVLAFPYSKSSGEVFLNKKQIKNDAKKFGLSAKDCEKYFTLHAVLHLKGFKHGAKMESQERKLLNKFKISFPLHLKDGKKKYSGRN